MPMIQIREQIKSAFEAARQKPGSQYDENELVWHLVSPPNGSNGIHNTFRGKRLLARFLNRLESDFTICFSLKDWESLRTLSQIEERVSYLLNTPKSSLASIRNILSARPPDMLMLLVAFIFIPVIALFFKLFGATSLMILIVPVSIFFLLAKSDRDNKRFYRELETKIKANKTNAGNRHSAVV